ncbi:MAG: hypothetical protein AAF702_03785 [Chloroflexota bacterium]
MQRMIKSIKKKVATSLIVVLAVIGVGASVFAQGVGNNSVFIPALASSVEADQSSTDLAGEAQESEDPYEVRQRQAVDLVAAHDEVARHLASYPGWVGNAWQEGEDSDLWTVNFILYGPGENEEEWLGEGQVNLGTNEILRVFVPRDLTTEEFQRGLQKVEALLERDPEVQAILGDPALWERHTYYNRWEHYWETSYWYGLEGIVARTTINDEGEVYLDSIYDPNAFDAEEQEMLHRNQAIEVAFEANGIDLALDNVDNWRTYVEAHEGSQYTVEFVSEGRTLFSTFVDIETWTVISNQ